MQTAVLLVAGVVVAIWSASWLAGIAVVLLACFWGVVLFVHGHQ
ncbi:MAG: hypothetical protein ACYDCH_12690 [Gaiellaceae bacterium]